METPKITTQKQAVLWHLENKGSITSWEAIKDYGITRLSHHIYTLRREGHEIHSEDVKFTNRFGNAGSYAKYVLLAPLKPGEQVTLF